MGDVFVTTNHEDGAKKLQESIIAALETLEFPTGLDIPNEGVIDGIKQHFDVTNFHVLNSESRIIRLQAHYTAHNVDGAEVFKLFIWCSAEYYRVGPENKTLPHYSWQIFLNNGRVKGPGHVIFEPSMEIKFYQRIEEQPVINDELEVKKSVALGSGKMEVDIEYCEFDEDLLDDAGNPVENGIHC